MAATDLCDKYNFRFEDNGEVISVDFPTMMTMDAGGFITVKGRVARRIDRPSQRRTVEEKGHVNAPMVSDALGFPAQGLEQWEADRVAHGFRSVEFVPDPHTPGFLQVHFHNRKERDRYIAHRQMVDRSSRNGSSAALTSGIVDRTRKLVEREFQS